MTANQVKSADSRFSIGVPKKFYSFIDIVMGPAWIGKTMVNSEMVSYYGSEPKLVQRHLLQASFYFISNERVDHERSLYTIQNMIGDLGGISAMLYNVSGLCAYYVSLQFVWGSLIQ